MTLVRMRRRSPTPESYDGSAGDMIARMFVAIGGASVLAIAVVRNAVVASFSEAQPEAAAKFWKNHPATQISLGMTQIALAARKGAAVPDGAFRLLRSAATREPLAPEPFLVRGVQAQFAGNATAAQRAFKAAQWRNPHSVQAAYFLSDHYLRIGDAGAGLRQLAVLTKLSPKGAVAISPYLVTYAADPKNWPALRSLFQANPTLADPVFVTMASNARTAPAVLALANPRENIRDAQWLPTLLTTLTDAGQHERAHAIWQKATGVRRAELIHDATFSDRTSPPPFNWDLTSSAVGLAERQPGARLHMLYYGQQDGILATQLLLLQPGSYRLSMQLLGDTARAKALNWSIWCDKAGSPISSVALDAAVRGWRFDVPSGCQAQWLKLSGSSSELPQQLDTTIANLKLERRAPGA